MYILCISCVSCVSCNFFLLLSRKKKFLFVVKKNISAAKNFSTKMFLFGSMYGMILRSSFDATQASLIFPCHSDHQIFLQRRPLQKMDYRADFSFVVPKKPPSVLVRTDANSTHMFLHYNFTMLRCLWGTDMETYDKISVFRDMTRWLEFHNHSLKANLYEPDDWLAWNIAEYHDDYVEEYAEEYADEHDDSEHHFD